MDFLQFYPTGERTAALMWAKFKRPVRHLCDPSAGKGHLIRYAQEGFPNLRDEEIPYTLTRLAAAIDEVHEKHGLLIGPSLKSSAPTKGIGQGSQAHSDAEVAVAPQQLLLAA